jgi:hypothetical protein
VWLLFEDNLRRRGSDGLLLLNIVAAPHAGKDGARAICSTLKKLANFSIISVAASVYDEVDDGTRVLLIGSCLVTGGEKWLAEHPRQAEWLREHAVRPDEAIEQYRAWLARREAQLAKKRANAEQHRHTDQGGTEQDDQRADR